MIKHDNGTYNFMWANKTRSRNNDSAAYFPFGTEVVVADGNGPEKHQECDMFCFESTSTTFLYDIHNIVGPLSREKGFFFFVRSSSQSLRIDTYWSGAKVCVNDTTKPIVT